MCDQLKAFGKCLITGFFISFAFSAEPDLDAARLVEKDNIKTLETGIWSYQKDRCTLDLVGVIHIADSGYYQKLNTLFESYDTVFFEMVANKSALKALRSRDNKAPNKKGENLSELNKMYSLYQTLMDLSLQTKEIDYSKKNFIHADMTETQFHKAQKNAGETLSTFIMGADIDLSKVDQGIMTRAMMTGESNILKTELIELLASADNSFESDGQESVLLGARNDTCLSIVNDNLQKNKELQNVAIFYGAAHLPDFHNKLIAQGWVLKTQDWLTAWKIEQVPEN